MIDTTIAKIFQKYINHIISSFNDNNFLNSGNRNYNSNFINKIPEQSCNYFNNVQNENKKSKGTKGNKDITLDKNILNLEDVINIILH